MKIGSLFAGIGGFDLAARWMGWRTKWYSEIDPYACRVMEKHFGKEDVADAQQSGRDGIHEREQSRHMATDIGGGGEDVTHGRSSRNHSGGVQGQGTQGGVYNVGDIRKWTPTVRDAVDIVCGGFPCQPVSLAGQRKAQDDERWLWPEFARVLGVLRPRYVVIENVPGLRSRGMADVLRDLSQIGYDAEWTSLSAADVGAPHRRERVWLLAYPQNNGTRRGQQLTQRGEETGDVAHPNAGRELQPQGGVTNQRGRTGDGDWWGVEPNVGRVAHGVPSRVDRLKCLGNAIVPQCAYEIFKSLK